MTVRTRFAPSPTGQLHLGNARTALYSALYAKKDEGVFILRIEDTDVLRSDLQFVESLKQDLEWLGVHWQEGLAVDGPYGPYWQSQRHDIYVRYYEQLISENLTYPCFCSDEELMLERKLQLSRGQAPRYRGTCRSLTANEIEERLASGLRPTLRFRVPQGAEIAFDDIVKGPQSFKSDDIGDFIIRRADGTASFMFCNAIDDALMKVTQVLRGEDHLANTPRQLMILKALRLPLPNYGHLALITGDDGTPLSKRHGACSVADLRQKGYLPSAIINYLGRLGHSYDEQHLLSFERLAKDFYLDKVSHSSARFDMVQLMHWQKMAVQGLKPEVLWHWLGEKVRKMVPEEQQDEFIKIVQPNLVFPEDAALWAEVFFHHQINFTEENMLVLQQAGEQFFVEAEQAVDAHGDDFKAFLHELQTALNLKGKSLYMPLRIALTGQTGGPELVQIAAILGHKRMRERFSRAFQLASRENKTPSSV